MRMHPRCCSVASATCKVSENAQKYSLRISYYPSLTPPLRVSQESRPRLRSLYCQRAARQASCLLESALAAPTTSRVRLRCQTPSGQARAAVQPSRCNSCLFVTIGAGLCRISTCPPGGVAQASRPPYRTSETHRQADWPYDRGPEISAQWERICGCDRPSSTATSASGRSGWGNRPPAVPASTTLAPSPAGAPALPTV